LYGKVNPSGRLPYTIAKQRSDYSADIVYVNNNSLPETNVDYTENLNIGYRHFLSNNITPRYAFGFGLSYTNFNYTNLKIKEIGDAAQKKRDLEEDMWYKRGSGANNTGPTPVGAFLRHSLQRPRWNITAQIQNTGNVSGHEVPQLYLAFPDSAGEPPKVLRDFERVELNPFEVKTVSFTLSQYDVSYWDVITQDWVMANGTYGVVVGKNSEDESLKGTFCPSGGC